MKKLFDDELSTGELKSLIKKFHKKEKVNRNIILITISALILIGITVMLVLKFMDKQSAFDEDWEDDDHFCDENGCYYTDEEDFEE